MAITSNLRVFEIYAMLSQIFNKIHIGSKHRTCVHFHQTPLRYIPEDKILQKPYIIRIFCLYWAVQLFTQDRRLTPVLLLLPRDCGLEDITHALRSFKRLELTHGAATRDHRSRPQISL